MLENKITFNSILIVFFFSGESLYNIILPKEDYEKLLKDKQQHKYCKQRHLTLSTLTQLPSDVCPNLSAIFYSGLLDAISCLPPPGGTNALDIFRSVLFTAYHLSSRLMNGFQNISSRYLRVDIIFDADYETVLGEHAVGFQNYLLWHLKRMFQKSQSDVHALTIKKGRYSFCYISIIKNK